MSLAAVGGTGEQRTGLGAAADVLEKPAGTPPASSHVLLLVSAGDRLAILAEILSLLPADFFDFPLAVSVAMSSVQEVPCNGKMDGKCSFLLFLFSSFFVVVSSLLC